MGRNPACYKQITFLTVFLTIIVLSSLISCSLQSGVILVPRESEPFYDLTPLPPGSTGRIITWGADALPGYACPQDTISFIWNYDPSGECVDLSNCHELTIIDNLGLLDPNFTTTTGFGSHTNGSVSELPDYSGDVPWTGGNPVFIFSITPDDPSSPGFENRESEVIIVQNPPAATVNDYYNISSVCEPGSGRWDLGHFRFDMSDDEFVHATRGFGDCVRIAHICYVPDPDDREAQHPDPITITFLPDESGAGPITLGNGDCAYGLDLKTNIQIDVQAATPPVPRYEGSCMAGRDEVGGSEPSIVTEPPYMQLLIQYGCDTTVDECSN